jgi:hypothetical protein
MTRKQSYLQRQSSPKDEDGEDGMVVVNENIDSGFGIEQKKV